MTNSKELFNELVNRVKLKESRDEIQTIIYLLLEDKYSLSKTDVMMGKEVNAAPKEYFNEIIQRINKHEPIQYILGKAEFYGRQFKVDPSVLIPRPETELLIRSVLKEEAISPTVLDIGTGSGCIAITLALEIPSSKIYAVDISDNALVVARQNAKQLQAGIDFSKADALADLKFSQEFDFILSNPPYIAISEKERMNTNVLNYEPHLALFVTDEDPLVFYKAIARNGKILLKPKGKIVVEINERFGQELIQLFENEGYRAVKIENDLDDKQRILIASR